MQYPRAGGTAPTNTRILGNSFASGPPDVRYSDGTQITGVYREYVQDLLFSVWTFTPDAPLVAGSTVTVTLNFGSPVTFTVEATADTTPPIAEGDPSNFEVHQLHYVESDVGGSTCGFPAAGETRTGAQIQTPVVHDDRAPDDALLYFSSSPWLPPASYYAVRPSSCYAPGGMFTPEPNPCTVITVEDAAGNSVALPMVCGSVVHRNVRLQAHFCYDVVPGAPDAGIEDSGTSSTAGDAGEDGAPDATSVIADAPEKDGCTCVSNTGGSSMLAGLGLLLGLLYFVRPRR